MIDRSPFQPAHIALTLLGLTLSLAAAQQPYCARSGYDALESRPAGHRGHAPGLLQQC